jgi:hypothetical protein
VRRPAIHSWLGRTLLVLFGIGFMLLGLRYFADPTALTGETDVAMPTTKAVMEIRTVYGGMFTGLGLIVTLFGLRKAMLAAGLRVLVAVAATVALARVGAIMLGQAPDPLFAVLLGIEVVGVVLALLALRGLARSD